VRASRRGGIEKRYWRITGHKGYDALFDERIPAGCITENQLQELLKCLTATAAGLSNKEISGAYVKHKTRRAHKILDFHSSGGFSYFCTTDPVTFCATFVDEANNIIKPFLSPQPPPNLPSEDGPGDRTTEREGRS